MGCWAQAGTPRGVHIPGDPQVGGLHMSQPFKPARRWWGEGAARTGALKPPGGPLTLRKQRRRCQGHFRLMRLSLIALIS